MRVRFRSTGGVMLAKGVVEEGTGARRLGYTMKGL